MEIAIIVLIIIVWLNLKSAINGVIFNQNIIARNQQTMSDDIDEIKGTLKGKK